MTLDEIKNEVNAGRKVYWMNIGYTVVKGGNEWSIVWNHGGRDENCIGLTWRDEQTLNGKPGEFFTRKTPFRLSYGGFLANITRFFETSERANQWAAQTGVLTRADFKIERMF